MTSANFNDLARAYREQVFPRFQKTLTRTSVTKTTSNMSGSETLTDGSTSSIKGIFYRKEDSWSQEYAGLLQNADAVLLILPSQTLNKEDKITYDSEDYRVQRITTRRMGTTEIYKVAHCFKV